MKKLLALLAASLLTLAACGPAAVAGATGTTVKASLVDMKIVLDPSSVPAGKVTFDVANKGTVTHELVVIKTDTAYDQLPPDPDEAGKVSEEGSRGESGDLEAGHSATFTLDLAPGNYVLICNEPGHYAAGMRAAFTVTK